MNTQNIESENSAAGFPLETIVMHGDLKNKRYFMEFTFEEN